MYTANEANIVLRICPPAKDCVTCHHQTDRRGLNAERFGAEAATDSEVKPTVVGKLFILRIRPRCLSKRERLADQASERWYPDR